VSLTPASDIVGKKPGRRLTGLLLVAIPVLLVCWMVIWPILSAIWRTVWIRNDGGTGSSFSLETYRFFFTDQYSLNNLTVTLWTTGVCAVLLLIICLPIAIYLRFSTSKHRGLCAGPRDLPDVRALDHPELRLHPRAGPERHRRPAAERGRTCQSIQVRPT
jgi:ABC-type sulfate transport system permease component